MGRIWVTNNQFVVKCNHFDKFGEDDNARLVCFHCEAFLLEVYILITLENRPFNNHFVVAVTRNFTYAHLIS